MMSYRPFSRRACLAGFGAALLAGPAAAQFVPGSDLLDPKWAATGTGGDPDHAPLAEFLLRWLRLPADGVARVDYAGALAAGADAPLRAWLEETQRVDPTTLAPGAAFAWWVNLYNAATVDLILQYHPVDSIRVIQGGLFQTGPWDEELLTVNGEALSLNDVEHRILRPIRRDPRVHYAVNCASIGCPNLKATPWTAPALEVDLEAAAGLYVNHPRGARVEDGRLIVSKIYDWFEEDFGGSQEGVIAHLRRYAVGELAEQLAGVDRVADAEYDWSLNAA